MQSKCWCIVLIASVCLLTQAEGGTFGRVIALGGHGSDLALDESRGVVYVANFTASQIDVVSTADLTRRTSMAVAAQPGSLALSRDGRYLLVSHYANYRPPSTAFSGVTLIRLDSGARQTFALPAPPLGVAFTSDNRALVVTSTEFLLYDPATGALRLLSTIGDLTARSLPVPPANFPPQITAASLAVSADGEHVYGLSDTFRFRFDRHPQRLVVHGYQSTPPQGPRVVSVAGDGSYYSAGWAVFSAGGTLLAQFPEPMGLLNVGSHAVDSARSLIYAQVPSAAGEAPVLLIADADNLHVRERLKLPENLAGKAVLNSDGSMMYAISDSGLMALPVGGWERQRRLTLSTEEVFFQSSFCDLRASSQEIRLADAGGGRLDFAVSGTGPGLAVTPSSGMTPAAIQVQVDPSAFAARQGTIETWLDVQSSEAVNMPLRIRVLLNLRQSDQRGTVVHVPGKLVDLLADPFRNRFYILRQDKNQVLVFDGSDYHQVAALRTGNTPTQMAFTFDRRYLMVGNDNSQIANVYDLETLQPAEPIRMPHGHYPRSLAASGRTILAACRVAGPIHTIDRVDFNMKTAVELPALGVYENDIDINTVLVAPPNGSSILAAEADGNLLLYNSTLDTFTISRKDHESLGGAYAASSLDWYVVDNFLLNSSLVPVARFEKGTGKTSGFAFADQVGFLSTIPSPESPGAMQRIDLGQGISSGAARLAEPPPAGSEGAAFTRSVAVLASRSALISLTTSGFTVLAWNYDAATAPPRISQVVNAADFTRPLAPGGLITIFGSGLSPVSIATSEMPLPRALGESCVTANGAAVPMLFASPSQINAQLPYEAEGNVTLVLHTPGGVSDSFGLQISATAPGVFRSGVAGPLANVATVVRAFNGMLVTPSNPIHRGDILVIYLTGLGHTWPAVDTGSPAPFDPLAFAAVQPTVTLGGQQVQIEYAGLTPGLVGVYQINVRVSDYAPTGLEVPLAVLQGGNSTTVPVRVVQ